MPLEFLAGVDAAARIDGALNQFARVIDLCRADRPADQRDAGVFGQDRFVAGAAKADPRFGASPIVVDATVQATPMRAKSPRRRATSMKQAPERGFATGSSTSTSISSAASAVASAPAKKSDAAIQRSPRVDWARN